VARSVKQRIFAVLTHLWCGGPQDRQLIALSVRAR